ncbi:MAG: serine hydrolase domain-containing protein [Deltaproteobacteria bacterium]|nr:serine hydrolase domain-containing protein [Deltaproteobacteria bacterium]
MANPVVRVGVLLAVLCTAAAAFGQAASLDDTLRPYLERYRLPALAAAVVRDGKVVAAGSVGTRRAGTARPVTLDDRFHIGSDTKAMTALLAAMLVEEGLLRWNSTVAEIFPELAAGMDARRRTVTLEQLLSHTSGEAADGPALVAVLDQSLAQPGNLDEMRRWLIREWGRQPLANPPGQGFTYANMNYVFAGAMIERVTGRTWDELISERVFAPLALSSAGLGNQATLGRVDAPLGHAIVDGKVKAFLAGPNGDNPPIIGPAGIAHMSVLDFARWAAWNAGEGKRGPALVRPETLQKLHTPVVAIPPKPDSPPGTPRGGKYGLGWGQVEVAWAAQPLLTHNGSNGANLAAIWVEPSRDAALVLMTNIASPQADAALLALAEQLYRGYVAVAAAELPTAPPTATRTRRPTAPPPTYTPRGPGGVGGFSGDLRRGKGL